MEEQEKKQSIYVQALEKIEEFQNLSVTRQNFLKEFIVLFIVNDKVREKNSYFAQLYMVNEKTIERYFSDLRKSGLLFQEVYAPYYEGKYHTIRSMWLDPLIKAKIKLFAKEIRENAKFNN